jgi:Cu-Zn family superoxide dismutase
MNRLINIAFAFTIVVSLSIADAGAQHSGHSNMSTAGQDITRAIALLAPTEGNNVTGAVTFTKTEGGIEVIANITGLTPGKHGFHVHEFGDCSSPDASSAGAHFNPGNKPHGAPDASSRHAGDIGNIEADSSGKASLKWTDSHMTFDGPGSIIGRAVIVHANEDDLKTQPTGNAGVRVACGVIGIAK